MSIDEYAATIAHAINNPSIKSVACLDILATEIPGCLWQPHARERAAELTTTADRAADAMATTIQCRREDAVLQYLAGPGGRDSDLTHKASEADYQRQSGAY